MTFHTGYRAPCIKSPVDKRNRAHHQYHTMVIVTIQVADARRTTTKGKRAKPVNLYGIDSSPSVEDDRPLRCGRNNNWGGSHHEANRTGSRVSEEAVEESKGSNNY